MAYPRFQVSRNFKVVSRSAGDITVNTPAATWQELAAETGGPGTGLFDIVLAAQVGDVIEAGFNALVANTTPDLYLDVKTIVGGSPVNSFIAQGASVSTGPPHGPWYAPASSYSRLAGSLLYTIVSGDLASGLVTLRPYAESTTSNRVVYAGSNHMFQFFARNLGPADPN